MARVRLEDLIDKWEPVLKKAFLDAVYQLRNAAQIELVAQMIERGDVDGAIRAVGLDPVNFRSFDVAISRSFEDAGNTTSASLPKTIGVQGVRVVARFDVRNLAAETWLRDHAAQAVSEIIADQRDMLRDTLRAGLEAGANPRTTALDIVGRINAVTGKREGGYLGLTRTQAEWVRNYETALRSDNPLDALTKALRDRRFDGLVKSAAESVNPLTGDQVTTMVTAYKNRALRYRAEAIARTETIAALHTAQEQAMQQAVDKGVIGQEAVSYIWRSAHDARVRDTHRVLDGQVRKMGELFDSPSGARLRFPGDPMAPISETAQCRCVREIRVDYFAGVR